MIKKPMLAGKAEELAKLKYPVLVSPKLDGIRCLASAGRVVSRKLLDIPNRYIRERLLLAMGNDPTGIELDGELMVGDTFQACTSGIMSRDGEPDFRFYVFDSFREGDANMPFAQRFARATEAVDRLNQVGFSELEMVSHRTCFGEEQLLAYEAQWLAQGYEGLMIRSSAGPYKQGRSTEREGYLLKLKRFTDAEAEIIGFEEMEHNANELQTDNLGHAKRSSAQEGKVGLDTLGKFLVRDLETGCEFAIGTGLGLTHELRRQIWESKHSYHGKLVKYRFQPYGVKEAPRLPIWLGFRDRIDSGE